MIRLMMILALLLVSVSAHAQSLDKAAVEKIVKEYIATHGDEVLTAVTTAQEQAKIGEFKKLINANTPVKGPATATVTVIEFSDFQCPYCDKVQDSLTQVRAAYGDKVRWAFKNLPLEFHPQARPAAYAAMAANKQGKFWEYSKKLWANQQNLGDKFYVQLAQELKLDMTKFEADRKSAAIKAIVDADMKDAQAVEARGTPYFVINGTGLSGALPVEAFKQVIDAELAKKK